MTIHIFSFFHDYSSGQPCEKCRCKFSALGNLRRHIWQRHVSSYHIKSSLTIWILISHKMFLGHMNTNLKHSRIWRNTRDVNIKLQTRTLKMWNMWMKICMAKKSVDAHVKRSWSPQFIYSIVTSSECEECPRRLDLDWSLNN